MADGIIRRFVRVIFDRSSAKKAEQELVEGIGTAGKKAGDSFARNLKTSFAKEMAELKVMLAKGLIDEKQFKQRADAAARAFNKGIVDGVEKARKAGTLTDKEFVKLGATLKRTGDQGATAGELIRTSFARLGATLVATFGIRAGIQFFKDSIEAALESERSIQRLDSALRPLGLTYQQVGTQAEVYLNRLQETTRFSDEDAREALTALVTGTGDYQRSLELLDVTAKIAEKRQISMTDAAQVAIAANQGVTRGMRDLGIATGETGDIIQKINENLGDLAVEGGRTHEGMIKRAINLWGEFKEKIGDAVLGTDALAESGTSLIVFLKDLNKWADENRDSISALTGVVLDLAGAFAKFIGLVGKYFQGPGKLKVVNGPLGPHLTLEGGAFGSKPDQGLPTAAPIVVTGPMGNRTRGTPTPNGAGKKSEVVDREAERAARKAARAQEKMLSEIDLIIPKVEQTKGAIGELVPVVDNMADAFGRAQQKLADDAAFQAEHFKTPWIDALGVIRNEVEGEGTLFAELGMAWAEGGFLGLAALAKAKVKENIARVIEELAKAAGSFALGNPASAAAHLKSAAGHGAAIVAWKAAAAVSGGGGASGGGAGAGGAGGFGTGNAAGTSKVPESEVHIYLTGPGFDALNPAVQKVVYGAMQNARERFGNNVKVHTRRTG